MWFLLLLALFLPTPAQTEANSGKFYVERVYVFSKYDPSFVLQLANTILPPNKEVSQADVECLITVLKDSGLFDQIKTKWSYSGKDIRTLELHCDPQPGREQFVVSRVSLVNLPQIDAWKFSNSITVKGVKAGVPLLNFTYDGINKAVDDSIGESVSPELLKDLGSAWISFKPDGEGKIEILVLENKPECPTR